MDEILDLIVRVFCDPSLDQIITLPPTYGMYNVIASTNNVENIEVPLNSPNAFETIERMAKKKQKLFSCVLPIIQLEIVLNIVMFLS